MKLHTKVIARVWYHGMNVVRGVTARVPLLGKPLSRAMSNVQYRGFNWIIRDTIAEYRAARDWTRA